MSLICTNPQRPRRALATLQRIQRLNERDLELDIARRRRLGLATSQDFEQLQSKIEADFRRDMRENYQRGVYEPKTWWEDNEPLPASRLPFPTLRSSD